MEQKRTRDYRYRGTRSYQNYEYRREYRNESRRYEPYEATRRYDKNEEKDGDHKPWLGTWISLQEWEEFQVLREEQENIKMQTIANMVAPNIVHRLEQILSSRNAQSSKTPKKKKRTTPKSQERHSEELKEHKREDLLNRRQQLMNRLDSIVDEGFRPFKDMLTQLIEMQKQRYEPEAEIENLNRNNTDTEEVPLLIHNTSKTIQFVDLS